MERVICNLPSPATLQDGQGNIVCQASDAIAETCPESQEIKVHIVVPGMAYAKFVPVHVLGVKAQISANLIDDDKTNDTEGAIRFVTSVDTLDYSEIGFKYAYNEKTGVSSSNKEYTQLYAVDGTTVYGNPVTKTVSQGIQ